MQPRGTTRGAGRRSLLPLAVAAVAVISQAGMPASARARPVRITFDCNIPSGGFNWNPPAGVDALRVIVRGGGGGADPRTTGDGGGGADILVSFPVTDTTLVIGSVGCSGNRWTRVGGLTGGRGGASAGVANAGANGGAASKLDTLDTQTGGIGVSIVAGGGGGGGGDGSGIGPDIGGEGGDALLVTSDSLNGQPGSDGDYGLPGGGRGGAGGAAPSSCPPTNPRTPVQFGEDGQSASGAGGGGGGGGGGATGGCGGRAGQAARDFLFGIVSRVGSGGGGGGGASLVEGDWSQFSFDSDNGGDGLIVIEYEL